MTSLSQNVMIDLNGELEYQAEAVVSRIVLKQSTGSVTAFAFDAGQELSEHTCPFDALLHVIEGEGSITIGGAHYTVAAGQMIRLPAHLPHAVKANQRFKMLLTMLRAATKSDD